MRNRMEACPSAVVPTALLAFAIVGCLGQTADPPKEGAQSLAIAQAADESYIMWWFCDDQCGCPAMPGCWEIACGCDWETCGGGQCVYSNWQMTITASCDSSCGCAPRAGFQLENTCTPDPVCEGICTYECPGPLPRGDRSPADPGD